MFFFSNMQGTFGITALTMKNLTILVFNYNIACVKLLLTIVKRPMEYLYFGFYPTVELFIISRIS